MTPPALDEPTAADLVELLKAGREFRALGKADAYRLLRWLPMAVADLAASGSTANRCAPRWPRAASSDPFSGRGPRAARRSCSCSAREKDIRSRQDGSRGADRCARGCPGRSRASSGAEIRTGADVTQIDVTDGTATGVALASGEQLRARAVVSARDPRRTLLGLVDPVHLAPDFSRHVQNIRVHGTLAKVNYAVSRLPDFNGAVSARRQSAGECPVGRVRLATDIDAIERPSMRRNTAVLPRNRGSSLPFRRSRIQRWRRPDSMSCRPTSSTRLSSGWNDWDLCARVSAASRADDRALRSRIRVVVMARDVITPLDLERTYGLTGGHIFHGELALDQCFMARPCLLDGLHDPGSPIYLCSAGTHPGTGLNGRSGALAARAIQRDLKRP